MSPRTPRSPPSPVSQPKSSARGFSARWLRGDHSIFQSIRNEWETLFTSEPRVEPFGHIDWFTAYGAAFEKTSTLAAITIQEDGRLQGVLPFVERTRCFHGIPARTLRSLSGKNSCRFDIVVSQRNRERIASLSWDILRTNPNWEVLEALDVPEGGAFEDVAACAQSDGYLIAKWPTLLSPYLEIPTDGTDPFTNCPGKHRNARKRLKKALERLQAKGTVRFEATTSNATEAMQRLITLESSGWKGARGSAIGSRSETREFYSKIAESFSLTGLLRIYTLWMNETPVAMELGLVHGGRYFSPKAAYDENFASSSPGHLLTRHIITDLAQHNIGRYDFLGPRARYKTVWAGAVRPHAHYRIFRPTIAGRLRHVIVGTIAPLAKQAKYAIRGDPQDVG